MKPILIVVHVYYLGQWSQIKATINNMLDFSHELYITTSHNNDEFDQSVHTSFPQAKLIKVGNIGYDIYPFITVINQVNLSNYSYVIKIHTKRDIDHNVFASNEWRLALMQFAQSKSSFSDHIQYLETHPQAGMLTCYKTVITSDYDPDKDAHSALERFIAQHNWPAIKYRFVAGTMFLVRANILQTLQDLHLTSKDFDQKNNHRSGFAHMVERLFGYLVYKDGYQIQDIKAPKIIQDFFYNFLLRYPNFYRRHTVGKGRLVIKIMGIRVYMSRRGRLPPEQK